MTRLRRALVLALIPALWLGVSVPAVIAAEVAVLYPEVAGAYARVFEHIIAGISEMPGIRVKTRSLPAEPDADEVAKWLKREQAEAIIALGQRGYQLTESLGGDIPVVVGASLLIPNGVTGISLAADPEEFFARLGTLTPPVRRVFIVYSEKNSGWLIPLAERAAKRHDIELIAREAGDMRGAVRQYDEILKQVRDPQDAIWLPLDNVAPDKTILPLVLEAAWTRRLVVFSNNPSHVQKGALFSLFPDHRGMGLRLAEMATGMVDSRKSPPGVVPLTDLKLAVNLRTASHLGMRYTSNQQRDFALVFPSR